MQNSNSQIRTLLKKIEKLSSQNESLRKRLNLSKEYTSILQYFNDKQAEILNNVAFPLLVVAVKENTPKKIVFANTAFLNFVKKDLNELIGKSPKRLLSKRKNTHIPAYSDAAFGELMKRKTLDFDAYIKVEQEEKTVNIFASILEDGSDKYIIAAFRDLTTELKYLKDIEEKEHRYKTFIENSESAIFRVAYKSPVSVKLSQKKLAEKLYNEGYLAECNAAFAKFMGFGDKDLLIGESLPKLFGSFENPRNREEMLRFVKNKFVLRNLVVRHFSLTGEKFRFSKNIFGIIENNKVTEIWVVYHDVTELEKIKENLEKSRDEFQNLFALSPVPMALVNEKLEIEAFNREMIHVFGYSVKELSNLTDLYGTVFKHLKNPEKIAKKWLAFAANVESGKKRNTVRTETSVLTKNGEVKSVIISFSYIGKKYLISVNDITETKKAKEEAERAKKIIENSPNILLQWELKGNRLELVYVTNNVSMLGYAASEFLSGKVRFNDILAGESKKTFFSEKKKAARTGKRKLTQKAEMLSPSGEPRYFESYVSVIREDGKTAFWEILSDITEKRHVEVQLRESIERYKTVFDNSPVGIFHFDASGKIIGFNSQFVKILSSAKRKLLGFNLLKQLENKGVLKAVKETLRGEKGFYEGNYVSVTSGKKLFIRFLGQPIFDDDGNVISGVGLFEDISAQMEARRELERTRDQFRKTAEQLNFILNHINDIVYEQDANKNLIFISGSVKKVLGYSPTEFVLRRRYILTDNPINEKIDEEIDSVLQRRKNTRYYIEMFAKNGKKVLLEVNESPIVKHGNVLGLIGVARDITETFKGQKIQQAIHDIAVKTYEAKSLQELYLYIHKTIARFMPAKNFFIAIFDPFANKISFQYFVDETDEESPEPREPRNGFTEFAIRTKQNTIFRKADLQKLIDEGKFELIGELPESIAVSFIKFSDGKKGVIVLQDYENPDAYNEEDVQFLKFVSTQIVQSIEKKKADDELLRTNEILRKAEKELRQKAEEERILNANKDKLFSIIAHDLRSPFTALLGLTQMLETMLDDMSMEEIKELVSALNNSATNIYKLLENLLNWARLQLGSFKISPEQINLFEIAVSVVNALSEPARQKEISLVNKVGKKTSAFADKHTVETIIRNLVNNAIKFTKAGGTITIKATKKNDTVEVTIADTGIGMSEQLIADLFKVNKKVSRPGTNQEAGTGLGLILVKDLVEKNGGKIWVKSEVNKGSEFHFTLPVKGN